MEKRLILGFVTIALLFAVPVTAGTGEDIADTLYRYYQADMDEDIETMMELLDTSFVDGPEEERYREDMRYIYNKFFEVYDTKSFELTDADVFYEGDDARVFYHLKSKVEAAKGGSYTIDNAFAAVLREDNGWKISYVLPRVQYEAQKTARAVMDNKIRDFQDNEVRYASSDEKGLFDMIIDFLKRLLIAIFSGGTDTSSTGGNLDDTDSQGRDAETLATEAYQDYISAYNRFTDLMTSGKGDTREAQEAYEDYIIAKRMYEDISQGITDKDPDDYKQVKSVYDDEDFDSGTGDTDISDTGVSEYSARSAQKAYQDYISAYNRLTDLMTSGKGDTPEAQEAYEEYKEKKALYERLSE